MICERVKNMMILLWEPAGVCTFKSIWQSGRVSFPAPCHKLSEEGSLSCLCACTLQPAKCSVSNTCQYNEASPKFHVTLTGLFNHCTQTLFRQISSLPSALTLMDLLTIPAISAKEMFPHKCYCFFFWIKDVSAGFCLVSNYFLLFPTISPVNDYIFLTLKRYTEQ